MLNYRDFRSEKDGGKKIIRETMQENFPELKDMRFHTEKVH